MLQRALGPVAQSPRTLLSSHLGPFVPLFLLPMLPTLEDTGDTHLFSLSVAPRNFPFRWLQISSSFANSTWSHTDGLVWLGELQTHACNGSDVVFFLKPCSQGSFSHQQWKELRHILRVSRSNLTRKIQNKQHKDCEVRVGTLGSHPR